MPVALCPCCSTIQKRCRGAVWSLCHGNGCPPCCGTILTPDSALAEHHEWRLSGGKDGCAGRVEVHYRGTWSTVCDSTWYMLEAAVLCHTLGCGEPLLRPSFHHTLPTKMLYECPDWQPSLAYCRWTYNKSAPCHESRAAGVICNGTAPFVPMGKGLGQQPTWVLRLQPLLCPPAGSLGLQTPTLEVTVMPSGGTSPSSKCASGEPRGEEVWVGECHELCPFSAAATKGLGAAGGLSLLHMPLFISCVVLAVLLLLTLVVFSTALLYLRKRSGEDPPGHRGCMGHCSQPYSH